jgi:Ketopantoate hydroxymethyltransferase
MWCTLLSRRPIRPGYKTLLHRVVSSVTATPHNHDYSRDRKLTSLELTNYKRKGKKIAMVTAYDFPSAKHAELAGFDIVLVGDSLGMLQRLES